MAVPPMDWRELLKNWVGPVVYTTVAVSLLPLAFLIYGDPQAWLNVMIFNVTYAAAHVVVIGIPATLILSKMQRESFSAYCAVGLIASWIMPIYFYVQERAYLQTINNVEKRNLGLEHSDLWMLLSGVPSMGFSLFATAIWWFINRRPKLKAAGVIPPPIGYQSPLF